MGLAPEKASRIIAGIHRQPATDPRSKNVVTTYGGTWIWDQSLLTVRINTRTRVKENRIGP